MSCRHHLGQVGDPRSPDSCGCRLEPKPRIKVLESRLRDLLDPWASEPPGDLISLSAALEVIRETLADEPTVTYAQRRGIETR